MRRFLCFSLCLGLMVSACKQKSLEESLNKAITQGKAGGGSGGGDDGGTTVTKKDKAAVLKACLPLMNTKMIELWAGFGHEVFYLRRNTVWDTTEADPLVVLYVGNGFPLEFALRTETGLGRTREAVTANLNAMAASEVIQNQFVARDGNASGWRVHISFANTDEEIPESAANNTAPAAPPAESGIIIYDRENVRVEGRQTHAILPGNNFGDANMGLQGGWFDCMVNDTTQDVTVEYTAADLT